MPKYTLDSGHAKGRETSSENYNLDAPFRFKCEKCSYGSNRKDHYTKHLAAKHSINIIWHFCEFCSYRAKVKDHLRRHKANKHDIDVTWHFCGIDGCRYRAKQRGNLLQHRSMNHPLHEQWRVCNMPECTFRTVHGREMEFHLVYKHNFNVRWFYCDINECPRRFESIDGIKEHLRDTHGVPDSDIKKDWFPGDPRELWDPSPADEDDGLVRVPRFTTRRGRISRPKLLYLV